MLSLVEGLCLVFIMASLCFGNWYDAPVANNIRQLSDELKKTNKILEVICQEIRNKNEN